MKNKIFDFLAYFCTSANWVWSLYTYANRFLFEIIFPHLLGPMSIILNREIGNTVISAPWKNLEKNLPK